MRSTLFACAVESWNEVPDRLPLVVNLTLSKLSLYPELLVRELVLNVSEERVSTPEFSLVAAQVDELLPLLDRVPDNDLLGAEVLPRPRAPMIML